MFTQSTRAITCAQVKHLWQAEWPLTNHCYLFSRNWLGRRLILTVASSHTSRKRSFFPPFSSSIPNRWRKGLKSKGFCLTSPQLPHAGCLIILGHQNREVLLHISGQRFTTTFRLKRVEESHGCRCRYYFEQGRWGRCALCDARWLIEMKTHISVNHWLTIKLGKNGKSKRSKGWTSLILWAMNRLKT